MCGCCCGSSRGTWRQRNRSSDQESVAEIPDEEGTESPPVGAGRTRHTERERETPSSLAFPRILPPLASTISTMFQTLRRKREMWIPCGGST